MPAEFCRNLRLGRIVTRCQVAVLRAVVGLLVDCIFESRPCVIMVEIQMNEEIRCKTVC